MAQESVTETYNSYCKKATSVKDNEDSLIENPLLKKWHDALLRFCHVRNRGCFAVYIKLYFAKIVLSLKLMAEERSAHGFLFLICSKSCMRWSYWISFNLPNPGNDEVINPSPVRFMERLLPTIQRLVSVGFDGLFRPPNEDSYHRGTCLCFLWVYLRRDSKEIKEVNPGFLIPMQNGWEWNRNNMCIYINRMFAFLRAYMTAASNSNYVFPSTNQKSLFNLLVDGGHVSI